MLLRRTVSAWALILILIPALASSALAQATKPAATTPARAPTGLTAELTPLKQLLDEIQQAIGHAGHTDQSLSELREKLAPIREGLRAQFDVLDPRLSEVDSRLSQLGPTPAAGAPPESPTIAAERAQLSQSRAEVDEALKETRLLSLRADDIAARINESRRSLFSRALFQRTPGVLDTGFWSETMRGLHTELQGISFLIRSSSEYARRNGSSWGVAASVATLIALAALAIAAAYGWRRRFARETDPGRSAGRFARALAALIALLRHALLMPICVFAIIKVLDGNGLLLPIVADLGLGLTVAVAVASFGRAIALAVLAPGAPHRRLVNSDELQAKRLTSCLTWSSRVLGTVIFLNLMHKAVGAPLSTTVATSALLAALIGLLVLYLLIGCRRPKPAPVCAGCASWAGCSSSSSRRRC